MFCVNVVIFTHNIWHLWSACEHHVWCKLLTLSRIVCHFVLSDFYVSRSWTLLNLPFTLSSRQQKLKAWMYRYHILVTECTFVSRVTHLGTLNSAMFPSLWHSSNVASVYGMFGLSFIVGNLLLPIISSISSCTFLWTSGLRAMNKSDHFIVVFVVSVPAMKRSWIVRFSCLSFEKKMN